MFFLRVKVQKRGYVFGGSKNFKYFLVIPDTVFGKL